MSFAARAARCDELSKSGGSLDQYFGFLHMLSQAQDEALRAWSESDGREASFEASVAAIAQRLRTQSTPRVAASLDRVLHATPAQRAAWADALRAGEHDAILPEVMPFVGAALQLQWHVRAMQAKATTTPAQARTTHCPVCAAPPLASILRNRGGVEGLRFLYCGICGTDWHYERITCSTCEATKGISYRYVPGAEHVKAEVCESCNAYRKIWYRSPADPIADDLATMHLDVLMGEAGVRRMSPNPLFAFG